MRDVGQRQYNITSLDISADGVLAAEYVNEFDPSVRLTVDTTVRLHAGSKITVSEWSLLVWHAFCLFSLVGAATQR